jgi:integral membrane protein MviN
MEEENIALNVSQGKKLASAAAIVMSSIVLSRLTGFLREIMLTQKIGLSWAQDAYIAAFTVPDLMYTLLVGGTISAALIPFLSSHLQKGEEEKAWKAVSIFINVVLIGMLVLSGLGILFADKIIPLVAHGLADKSAETKELAVRLTRILFPSVSFIMLAGICNGVLNSYKKFAAAAYGPTVYNVGCIISIYLFADEKVSSMQKVAIGVSLSAAAYFLFQFAFAFRNFKFYRLLMDLKNLEFIALFKQAIPSLLSSSLVQVNVIISTSFVSLFAFGGISAFRNANTAWQLPYGIFAMGIGTAILPTLSRKFAAGEIDEYRHILTKTLTSTLFLTMPSAVGFIVLREPVVQAIFKWNSKFSDKSISLVAGILAIFSVAMVTQSIVATINRGFYAIHNTKTPLFIGVISVILNLCFGFIFYKTTKLGPEGMALSYSIISTINSILLIILLERKIKGVILGKFFVFLSKSIPASIVMGVLLYFLNRIPVQLDSKASQLLFLLFEVLTGASVYYVIMLLTKSNEAVYFFNILKHKLNLEKICKKLQKSH